MLSALLYHRLTRGPRYRYEKSNAQQALILKSVRLFSALLSMRTLIENGLHLDAAAIFRISDEMQSDIFFLAASLVFKSEPEKIHEQFLKEFFQEEFDHPDILKSSQKRNRVSRRRIRAYNAHAYSNDRNTSKAISVNETIDSACLQVTFMGLQST